MIILALAMGVSNPAVCVKLANDYENASKMLAENFANVPDQTQRSNDDGKIIDKSRFITDMMRDNRCKLPTEIPNAQPYLIPALECATYRLEHNFASDGPCDWSLWKRQ